MPATQSFFFYPLSTVLASEASVRVLRALVRTGDALSAPAIAKRTHLSRAWVLRILGDLGTTGVVESLGQGRSILYRLRSSHSLAGAIQSLFDAEAKRADQVLDAVRAAAASIPSPPDAVWLIGSVARGEDTPGSDLDLVAVFPGEAADRAADQLRDAMDPTAEANAVTLSVVPLDHADVTRLSAGDPFWREIERDAMPLVGPPPAVLARRLRRIAMGPAHG